MSSDYKIKLSAELSVDYETANVALQLLKIYAKENGLSFNFELPKNDTKEVEKQHPVQIRELITTGGEIKWQLFYGDTYSIIDKRLAEILGTLSEVEVVRLKMWK